MPGKLYGIGVGPGDPELLTLKAYRILQEVDLICVPKSAAERESLALLIIKKALNRHWEVLELSFPMSRDRQVLERHWAEAAEKVASLVQEGKKVAFITIGDPMFYSTYGYLLGYLQKFYPHIPVETVPGVTAMSACAAVLQIPLAEGDENLVVMPAAYNLEQLNKVVGSFDNVVVMKVNRNFDKVLEVLQQKNLIDQAALVSRCGYPDQFICRNLRELVNQNNLHYMSTLIVRKRWER